MDGPIISSNSVDKGVGDAFANSDCEVVYFDLVIKAQLFMDDIFCMAGNRNSAQYANDVMEDMIEKKSLSFNTDKTCYLIMGNRNARKKLSAQCKKNPLTLNGAQMKEVTAVKYLGDYVSFDLE